MSSIGIWAFHFMVLRGMKEAAAINKIVTIAKIIPLLVFLVLVIFAFKPDVFAANLWGGTGVAQDYLHAHDDSSPPDRPRPGLRQPVRRRSWRRC